MSETLGEPVGGDHVGDPLAHEPADVTPADVPGELPATDAPGAKIHICPACGNRYDEPTFCTNGHDPTQTVEYDRETVEKADAGDADAISSVNETALAAGNMAGAKVTEATPAVDPLPQAPATPTAAVDPAATAPGDAAAIAAGSPTSAPVVAAPGAAVPGSVETTTTPDGIGGTPASVVTPDGVHPNVAAVGAAIADLEAACRAARTALGL